MKNVVLLDTTVGSMNVGDNIIKEAIDKALQDLFMESNVRTIPTRTIAFPWYQIPRDFRASYVKNADYKFVCGTNLLHTCMLHHVNQWNINIFNCKPLENSILVGVGAEKGRVYLDWYTRKLYKKVLSPNYIHSTRDELAKNIVEDLGLHAINTGCPTLWGLSKEFCRNIPRSKSEIAVCTLHHGRKDREYDQILLETVSRNYRKVFFFPQTPYDVHYLNTFRGADRITVLPSNLAAFKSFLTKTEVDYVGVRLHGAIFAMQQKKRAILVMVDERTRNMGKTHSLNCVERSDPAKLEQMINSEFQTRVKLDYDAISQWISQFGLTIGLNSAF